MKTRIITLFGTLIVGTVLAGGLATTDKGGVVKARAAKQADSDSAVTWAAIKADLDQVEAALDQIDVSATSSYATNISLCTGATKTALQDTRKILVDLKAASKNLMQASRKAVKKSKAEEAANRKAGLE